MINKHMKRYTRSLALLGKRKLKTQRDTTSNPLGCSSQKDRELTNIGKYVEKPKLSYTAGGCVK